MCIYMYSHILIYKYVIENLEALLHILGVTSILVAIFGYFFKFFARIISLFPAFLQLLCMCMYICIHVCICIYKHVHTREILLALYRTIPKIYAHAHICLHIYVYVDIFIYVCMRKKTCTSFRFLLQTSKINVFVRTYTFLNVYI